MEDYLNILHFCLYKVHYKLYLVTKRLNPFRLLFKIPIVKRRAERESIDLDLSVDTAFADKRFGLSTVAAGGFLWGGIFTFFFSVLMMLKIAISTPLIAGCGIGAGLICYVFVFKQDKYIKYFDKYEKWSGKEKRKYGWLTIGSILFVLLTFYICLIS